MIAQLCHSSDTEFPLGRCLPADPTAADILQVRLPVPSTGLHCLHQNHRLKTWWSRRCRGLIGFLCVRGSGVLPIPAGGKGGAFHLVVCEIKERGKFFVTKLSHFSYSFYIWFSGTERSEERHLKWIGIFRWLFEPRKPRIKQISLKPPFLGHPWHLLHTVIIQTIMDYVMLQEEHRSSPRISVSGTSKA